MSVKILGPGLSPPQALSLETSVPLAQNIISSFVSVQARAPQTSSLNTHTHPPPHDVDQKVFHDAPSPKKCVTVSLIKYVGPNNIIRINVLAAKESF